MAKTIAQQIEDVELAITKILEGGQKLESDDDVLEYGDLETLYKIQDSLEKKAALANRTGRTLARF